MKVFAKIIVFCHVSLSLPLPPFQYISDLLFDQDQRAKSKNLSLHL